MTIAIQTPEPGDRGDWERLYRGYAEFYEVPMNDTILQTVWDWIFDADKAFY